MAAPHSNGAEWLQALTAAVRAVPDGEQPEWLQGLAAAVNAADEKAQVRHAELKKQAAENHAELVKKLDAQAEENRLLHAQAEKHREKQTRKINDTTKCGRQTVKEIEAKLLEMQASIQNNITELAAGVQNSIATSNDTMRTAFAAAVDGVERKHKKKNKKKGDKKKKNKKKKQARVAAARRHRAAHAT